MALQYWNDFRKPPGIVLGEKKGRQSNSVSSLPFKNVLHCSKTQALGKNFLHTLALTFHRPGWFFSKSVHEFHADPLFKMFITHFCYELSKYYFSKRTTVLHSTRLVKISFLLCRVQTYNIQPARTMNHGLINTSQCCQSFYLIVRLCISISFGSPLTEWPCRKKSRGPYNKIYEVCVAVSLEFNEIIFYY
jgi:hypothetical protein